MTSPIDDQVRRVAADVFNVSIETLRHDATRDDIAEWDSLRHINLVIALEQTFGIQFSPEHMEQMLSLELVTLIVRELTATHDHRS